MKMVKNTKSASKSKNSHQYLQLLEQRLPLLKDDLTVLPEWKGCCKSSLFYVVFYEKIAWLFFNPKKKFIGKNLNHIYVL